MKSWFLALCIAASVACISVPTQPPPVTTPPPAPSVGIGFTVYGYAHSVHITILPGQQSCDTNDHGIAYCIAPVTSTAAHVDTPAGYQPFYDLPLSLTPGENTELIIVFQPLVPPTPGQEHGFIRIEGWNFIDEDNKPWPFAGYAAYTLVSNIKKGQDVGPFFDEAARYGANTVVVLATDIGPWALANGYDVDSRDPQWKTWLTTLFDTAAAHKMRVALGVFQQVQVLSDAEKLQAWNTAQDVVRGRWNAFLRLGNEDGVNGWSHDMYPKPTNLGGVLVSTGSQGIDTPPAPPQWDFQEWEPRRAPWHKVMDDAGAGVLEQHVGVPGALPFPGPIVVIEPPFFHDTPHDQWGDARWTNPKDALMLGLEIGTNTAGGVFGSSNSLNGLTNGPIAAECARQFFRGLHASFLR